MQNHAYIGQLVQELIKWYFQASVGDYYYECLLIMNRALTNIVHRVPQVCQYILVNAKKFMYIFFPIIYCSLSTECLWFSLFHHKNCFVLLNVFHNSVHWGINHLSKHHPLFFTKPPLNQQTVQVPPLFRQSSCLNWFFVNPSPQSRNFQWTPKILKLFHP